VYQEGARSNGARCIGSVLSARRDRSVLEERRSAKSPKKRKSKKDRWTAGRPMRRPMMLPYRLPATADDSAHGQIASNHACEAILSWAALEHNSSPRTQCAHTTI